VSERRGKVRKKRKGKDLDESKERE